MTRTRPSPVTFAAVALLATAATLAPPTPAHAQNGGERFSEDLMDTQFLFGEREKLIHRLEEDLEKTRLEAEDVRYATPLWRLLARRLRRRFDEFRKRTDSAESE